MIAGGVGAAKLLRGLQDIVAPSDLTAIVNVADDCELHGLWISPDLDTVTYTCAEAIDTERGWGLGSESWQAMETLRRYSSAAGRNDLSWFNLGDRDLGTHLFRTSRRHEGAPLSEITREITQAWGINFTILPSTDDQIATKLMSNGIQLDFQEYFVREQHGVAVQSIDIVGADHAVPGPGVLAAIADADVVIIAPSNPIVSIGPVLAIPGIRKALQARRSRVVAISGIVGGVALKGPADRLLTELGHRSSAAGVAELYADIAATMVIDEVDRDLIDEIVAVGVTPIVADTIMVDRRAAARLGAVCLASIEQAP